MQTIKQQTRQAVVQLLDAAHLEPKDLLVVGCSSSEVQGARIGSASDPRIAEEIFQVLYTAAQERDVFLAAQCCEHLNRAVILERKAARLYGYEEVNVVPLPKAGGSFAAAAYANFQYPVAVERIQAHAGMDIGDVLIGMQLRPVAVPVRLEIREIGSAHLVCARTRPKFIGGERAHYDSNKM